MDLVAAAFMAWTVPTPWQSRPYGTLDKAAIATLERLLAQPGLEPVQRCRLLNAYAVERADQGDPEARAAAEQGAALATQFGDPVLYANLLATLSRELDADLEWERKAAIGRDLIQIGEDAGLPEYRCYGRIVQARAAAAAGDPTTARRLVAECLDIARTYRLTEMIDVSEIAQAMFAHIEGDHEAARRRYTEVSSRMTRQGSPHGTAYRHIAEAVISLELGHTTEFATTAGALHERFGPALADLHALAQAALGRTDDARRIRRTTGPMPRDCFFTLSATFRAMAVTALEEREEAAEIYRLLQPYHGSVAGAASLSVAARPHRHDARRTGDAGRRRSGHRFTRS